MPAMSIQNDSLLELLKIYPLDKIFSPYSTQATIKAEDYKEIKPHGIAALPTQKVQKLARSTSNQMDI